MRKLFLFAGLCCFFSCRPVLETEVSPEVSLYAPKLVVTNTIWTKLPGSLGNDIAADDYGNVYLTNQAGNIYRFSRSQNAWQLLSGSNGNAISANSGRLYLTNTLGYVYRWSLSQSSWQFLSPSNARDIAVNQNGQVWMVDAFGNIFKQSGGQSWTQMPGSNAVRIAAGGGQVWLINSLGYIYRYDALANSWEIMPGSNARDIAVSNDGKIFLTNTLGYLYQWNGVSWNLLEAVQGSKITIGQGHLYLVKTDGDIYRKPL